MSKTSKLMSSVIITSSNKTVVVAVPDAVEQILQRVEACQGVMGSTVFNQEFNILRCTMDTSLAERSGPLMRELGDMAVHMVRDVDPADQLICVRLQTRRYEMMLVPEVEFTLLLLQSPVKQA